MFHTLQEVGCWEKSVLLRPAYLHPKTSQTHRTHAQCPWRILGIIGHNPSVSKPNQLGWGEPTRILVPWRQGFRHPTRNECMGWFAQINQLHVLIFRFSFINLRYILEIPIKCWVIFRKPWTSIGSSVTMQLVLPIHCSCVWLHALKNKSMFIKLRNRITFTWAKGQAHK